MARRAPESESHVPFVHGQTHQKVDAFAHTRILTSSDGLGWKGLRVEAGVNDGWSPGPLAVEEHYLSINLDVRPLTFESVQDGRARRVVMEPGSIWLCPAGETFVHSVSEPCRFGVVTLAPGKLERLAGRAEVALTRQYGVQSAPLEHLVRALISETERHGESGVAFVEALASAISLHLARHFTARPSREATPTGGLPPRRLQAVLELMEARLGEGVSLEDLAAEARLSPFHFARAFKKATGASPHQHLLQRRLERAKELLARPDSRIGDVAFRLGFSDQSHLTRLFRRHYGMTPRAYQRGASPR